MTLHDSLFCQHCAGAPAALVFALPGACGIYNDAAQVQAMLEDAATVAKACTLLAELEENGCPVATAAGALGQQ